MPTDTQAPATVETTATEQQAQTTSQPEAAGDSAQAPVVEAATTEGKAADSALSGAKGQQTPKDKESQTPVNWDDDANPHKAEAKRLKDQFEGTRGSLKQTTDRARQLEAELAQIRQSGEQERQRETQRQRLAQDWQAAQEEWAGLEAADQDDERVKRARARLQSRMQGMQDAWRQVHQQPQNEEAVRRQADELSVHRMELWIADLGADFGLTPEEIAAIAQEHSGDYEAARKAFAVRAVEKARGPVAAELEALKKELGDLRKATEEQRKALQRASEGRPDTTRGEPRATDDDDAFMKRYGRSEVDSPADHKRAREIMARW